MPGTQGPPPAEVTTPIAFVAPGRACTIAVEADAEMSRYLTQLTTNASNFSMEELRTLLLAFSQECAYTGLNTKDMRAFIIYKLKNHHEFDPVKTVQRLIVVGLIRGNNLTAAFKTMDSTTANTIKQITDYLSIKDKVMSNMTSITLSRVTMCFPEMTAMVAAAINYAGIWEGCPQDFPSCMRCVAFGALIPIGPSSRGLNEDQVATIKKAFTHYSAEFSRVVAKKGSKAKTANHSKLYKVQKKFVQISQSQSLITEARRHQLLMSPALKIVESGALHPSILAMSSLTQSMIESDDEDDSDSEESPEASPEEETRR